MKPSTARLLALAMMSRSVCFGSTNFFHHLQSIIEGMRKLRIITLLAV
jgi:hypothetical protein